MATVAEVQAEAPVPQAVQTPDDKKYPEAQVVATVAEVQAVAPTAQATQAPELTKNPEEQVKA